MDGGVVVDAVGALLEIAGSAAGQDGAAAAVLAGPQVLKVDQDL